MKVSQVMTKSVSTLSPSDSIHKAAQIMMKELDIGVIPVCDQHKLVGMITDRDITIRACASNLNIEKETLSSILSEDLVFCHDDHEVEEAARLMKQHEVRRLPVLTRDKQLVGIVSLGDVYQQPDKKHLSGEVLQAVSRH